MNWCFIHRIRLIWPPWIISVPNLKKCLSDERFSNDFLAISRQSNLFPIFFCFLCWVGYLWDHLVYWIFAKQIYFLRISVIAMVNSKCRKCPFFVFSKFLNLFQFSCYLKSIKISKTISDYFTKQSGFICHKIFAFGKYLFRKFSHFSKDILANT